VNAQTGSPEGSTGPGAESDIYDCLVVLWGGPYSLCSALSGELTGTLASASSTNRQISYHVNYYETKPCKYLVRCEIVGVSSMWITVETVSEVDRRKVDTLARHSTSYWHIYNANNAANM